jgi:ABC-type multidrug transport system fused ATPase/permease subunit
MKQYILAILVALSAFAISASAAFYSITGLTKLFAGVGFAIFIMATALEVSKLVIASLLYQYWSEINKVLRAYLTAAMIVLMVITSAGIYGLLSSGYEVTANKLEVNKATIENVEKQKALFETQKAALEQELNLINTNLNDLRKSGSSTITEQVYDKRTKQYVTKAVRVPAKFIEKQIDVISNQKSTKDEKLSAVNDSIFACETKILNLKTDNDISTEIGPLIYLSKITGRTMDEVINWFLLLIIFVFDPLAIALVIAANFLFAKISKSSETNNKQEDKPIEEQIESMRDVVESYDSLQNEIDNFNDTEPTVETETSPETVYSTIEQPTTYEEINQREQQQIEKKQFKPLTEEQKKWMSAEQIEAYNKQFNE